MAGVESVSGGFFPEDLLDGSDLCSQVGLLQGRTFGYLRALRASFSALDSCPGIWSAGVPGRRE